MSKHLIIILMAVLITVSLALFTKPIKKTENIVPVVPSKSVNKLNILNTNIPSDIIRVKTEQNKTKSNLVDIYLVSSSSGELLFARESNIYDSHYYSAEFKNQNLYIIKRTGGSLGYQTNPNWSDSLWKYDIQGNGEELANERGLDFRISESGKIAAIQKSQTIEFLDIKSKKVLYLFAPIGEPEAELCQIDLRGWNTNADIFWAGCGLGPNTGEYIKIDPVNKTQEHYSVISNASGPALLNTDRAILTYDSRPIMFQIEDYEEWKKTNPKLTIYMYNLETKREKVIATFNDPDKFESIGWISETEYVYKYDDQEMKYTLPQ